MSCSNREGAGTLNATRIQGWHNICFENYMTVIRSGMSFIGLVFAIVLYSVAAAAATARDATAARSTTNNKNVTRPPLRGQGGVP